MSVLIKGGGFGTKPDTTATVKPLAQCTISEMLEIIEMHYANEIELPAFWSVGDAIAVSLSAINTPIAPGSQTYEQHSAQNTYLRIIDFEHDTLQRPINGHTKAAVTFLMNPLSEEGPMTLSESNSMGWIDCDRRAWLINYFGGMLPSDLNNNIKPVQKAANWGYDSSEPQYSIVTDTFFLLAEAEIYGEASVTYGLPNEGTQYGWFKTTSNIVSGWTRSACVNYENQFAVARGNSGCFPQLSNEDDYLNIALCI